MHPFVSFGGGGILLQRRTGGFLWINSFRSLADHFLGMCLWQPNFVILKFSQFPPYQLRNHGDKGNSCLVKSTRCRPYYHNHWDQSLPPTLSETPNFIRGGPFDSLTIFFSKNGTLAHKNVICQIIYTSKIPKLINFTRYKRVNHDIFGQKLR